jgi:hypothetical protein
MSRLLPWLPCRRRIALKLLVPLSAVLLRQGLLTGQLRSALPVIASGP